MQASNQPYYWTTPTQQHMDQNLYAGDVSQGSHFSDQTPELANNSSSSVGFSPNGSPVSLQDSHSFQPDPYHSPDYTYTSHVSKAGFEENVNDLQLRLSGIQTVLDTDQEFAESFDVSSSWAESGLDNPNPVNDQYRIMKQIIARGDLKEGLFACAKAVAENDTVTAEWLISMLRLLVSVSGEPAQRLGAYMLEGLVAKMSSSACPYFKFGYLSANGAIAEATKNEDKIHIIDFQIAQGGQWVTLTQSLAARPGGPPKLRITGIDDARNSFARGGGLNIIGQKLTKLAESCKVPFEFHAVPVSGSDIELHHFKVQPGEALAVNCAFVLHHVPDESVNPQNHRDRLLRLIKSLSPKVVTLVEQEANVNTAKFFHRTNQVEQHCLAGEIVNILACEGAEREERRELLGKWRSRFTMAGFTPYPLSSYVNGTIKTLLEDYCDKYRLEERDGALFLGWMNRDLVSSCAWN
nr:hypothetical protein [Tanacetum cinerariifolium]